ncbi:MAG: exopolysaccharide Pel transporter PelG [Usitatibacteraceae bacterium]
MKSTNNVARNAAWLIAQPILVGIVSIVVIALVARDLGTANYGTLLLLLSYVAVFSQIGGLGLRPYSVREIAADRNRAAEIVSDMLVLRSLLAVMTMILAIAFLAFVDPSLPAPLVVALCALILLNALAGCFIDGLQGLEHMKAVATSFAFGGVFVQLACLAALFFHLGLYGIVAAYTIGALVMLAIVWYQFYRATGGLIARGVGSHQLVHLHKSWAFLLQNVVGTIRGRVDLLLVNAILGLHAAGIYGSATILIQRLDQINDGISTALFPRIAHLHGRSSRELIDLVRGALKVVLLMSTPMAVGLLAVSSDVIDLMFGSQYSESGAVLAILGGAIPFMFVTGVLYTALRAMGLEGVVFIISVRATVLTVAFLIICTFVTGVRGAALASLLGSATLAAMLIAEYWRRVGMPWVTRDLAHIIIANSAMGVALYLLRYQHLAIKVIVAAVVFALVARMLGLVTMSMLKNLFASREQMH